MEKDYIIENEWIFDTEGAELSKVYLQSDESKPKVQSITPVLNHICLQNGTLSFNIIEHKIKVPIGVLRKITRILNNEI